MMKTSKAFLFAPLAVLVALSGLMQPAGPANRALAGFFVSGTSGSGSDGELVREKGCVFRTLFGEESSDSAFHVKTPARVASSTDDGLAWLSKAQLTNGGWGAGTHARQDIFDPHAVDADPATTAMVAMALLRTGSTPTTGPYAANLALATDYLVRQVEQSADGSPNITSLAGTQPQRKLGANIDVVMTTQYFTNLMPTLDNNPKLKGTVKKCLDKCVAKIQGGLNQNGSMQGAGWAGVLQSSFAANALESAQSQGIAVDEDKLDKARHYNKSKYDVKANTISTEEAAGVMLYSISGSTRSSAKEARQAKDRINEAKREGLLAPDADVTVDNLKKAGLSDDEAMQVGTAYSINQAAKIQAQRNDVMSGFGSNGGEEFLSYLQTGEGLIMSKDLEWKKWYDNISGRLIKIQNNDGSWNGHHCITSPVFCTATALLILSVNRDVDQLMAMGKSR